MKLLGVEFENFARFARCYVPLNKEVLVLAGKNNSGKTALLRGLTALSGLPFHDRQAISDSLAGYAKRTDSISQFDINVWFEYEASDPRVFETNDEHWQWIIQEERPSAKFLFKIWPKHNICVLEACDFILHGKAFRVLERAASGQLSFYVVSKEGTVVRGTAWPMTQSQPAPDKRQFQLHARDGFLSGFKDIGRVQFIDAHRSILSNQPSQATDNLAPSGANLAPFLLTTKEKERDLFVEIETFLLAVFPEFKYLNAELTQTYVNISLTLKQTGQKIPLTHCGTGVEQILILATSIFSGPASTTFCLDEPHSFLHPHAERALIGLLLKHRQHKYVIGTHSPVVFNSVPASCILYLPLEIQDFPRNLRAEVSSQQIISTLGYKNSDFLQYDRLIFVEGESDQHILPALLKNSMGIDPSEIDRTGFPVTGGSDQKRSIAKQTIILKHERILDQLGRAGIPRVYLRDGDAKPDEKTLLSGTHNPSTGDQLKIRFLPKIEIENYLLVPTAIVKAIQGQAKLEGIELAVPSIDEVQGIISKCGNAKGSEILEAVFDSFGLSFSKKTSGCLVAQFVNGENQPDLVQIVDLVKDIY